MQGKEHPDKNTERMVIYKNGGTCAPDTDPVGEGCPGQGYNTGCGNIFEKRFQKEAKTAER